MIGSGNPGIFTRFFARLDPRNWPPAPVLVQTLDDLGPGVKFLLPQAEIRECGKTRLELVPAAAMRAEAKAYDHGNKKDGRAPFNWRVARVTANDQAGGALRHLMAWLEGEDCDEEGVDHLGAVRARCGIILDARAHGNLIDDRVTGRK